MAVDKTLTPYEVTASISATATDGVQAEDRQSAAELVAESVTLTVGGDEIDATVEIEDVLEVEHGR